MGHSRPFIRQGSKMSILQIIGAILLLLGLGLLIFIGFDDFFNTPLPANVLTAKEQAGSLAATSFFLVMMGMALLFPEMLKGADDGTSSMRVAVFMVVSVFAILSVKIYWHCGSGDFKLDNAWAGVVAAALGSKALQSLGENKAFSRNGAPPEPSADNPFFSGQAPAPDLPLHDSNLLQQAPTTPPSTITTKTGSL